MQRPLAVFFLSRVFSIYVSRQFLKYVVCGAISSLIHLVARWVLNHYMTFGWAVFLSYFVGMPVALVLYRIFVFQGQERSVIRQFGFFSLAYFGFLPLTWLLSVISERPLLAVLPVASAQLVAHLIGVAGPVVLNFAYNKFITFKEALPTGRATL
jgi:putative flippase GtrA